jgi:HAD superfamily hydrolase (TIGR01509 family)
VIKAIIFDIGGVLIRTEDRGPRSALERQMGMAPGEAEFLVYNSEQGRKAQLGLVTAGQHWGWIQRHLGLTDAQLQDFRTAFWGGDRVDHELVELIRALRPRYQTAVISNAMDDLRQVLLQLGPTEELFDLVVGSAYEQVMKPAAVIYERTLARLGRSAAEAIFIDDASANIAGAQAVGLATIHYQPGIDVRAELAQRGVRLSM